MALLLAAKDITKSFGARPLFEKLTFAVESGERIGLIGPNGAGKSTLLRLIAGLDSVDSGEISMSKGLRIGFLEQTPKIPAGLNVDQAVQGDSAGEWLSRLELTGLLSTPVEKLSGGWKKRVALARELVRSPDLLLLDEPTNHLDIESILWLENFLSQASFATITITHDRLFLQRVSTRILELDKRNPGGIFNVRGDYATYCERKELLLETQLKQEASLRNTLRRETEWLRQGAKARTTKQQARIQAAAVLAEQVEELEYRNQSRTARIDFQSSDRQPKRLLEAKGISKAYGDKTLFQGVDVFVGPGSRVGLLGSNGCGKSTLIRVLLGKEAPDSGTVFRSDHLKVAYFEQNREELDPTQTLRKTLCPSGDEVCYRGKMVHIHGYLDRFLFRREQVDMLIGKLSGGEQSRVALARLMLKEANVLVLDEPTNDLDVETLNVLQSCLTEFDGAVLLVTHDRYFLDQVATQILAFEETPAGSAKIVSFAGLDQWEKWHRERKTLQRQVEKASTRSAPTGRRKLSYNETRELSQMETRIQAAEEKLSRLEMESQDPIHQSNGAKLTEIFEAIAATQKEIENLYTRWSELDALSKQN